MTRAVALAAAAALLAVAGCSSGGGGGRSSAAPTTTSTSATSTTRTPTATPTTTTATTTKPTTPTARWQHVVIAVMENHSYSDIIGNSSAPFLNRLAASGASFTQAFAERHPSEPNYLALFSGSTHGLTDDHCPLTYRGPDLGSELRAAGHSFAGYSEGLPRTGSLECTHGRYARRHVPWSDFTDLPASVNRPMSAFPSDPDRLPAVSFVIPDLDHDMHDGTVTAGDDWLRTHLGSYASWAPTHDSLLVVTWDEDDRSESNRIPTIAVGAHVRPGRVAERIDHYRLLRTIEDAFQVPPLGRAARATPISRLDG